MNARWGACVKDSNNDMMMNGLCYIYFLLFYYLFHNFLISLFLSSQIMSPFTPWARTHTHPSRYLFFICFVRVSPNEVCCLASQPDMSSQCKDLPSPFFHSLSLNISIQYRYHYYYYYYLTVVLRKDLSTFFLGTH